MRMSLVILSTIAACLGASYCDVRTRRIPNVLTGSLALGALVVHAAFGLWPLAECFAVMAVLTAGGTLLYARGGIGAGDIKLAIAGSGMLSFPLCVTFLLYTAISGGVLALLFMIVRANARTMLSRAVYMTLAGTPGITTDKREKMPYAVAFALGAILVALSQSIAPFLRINI
jgi:prepilin peptidase CpaA